jgi:2-methylfumaryl-CoA isomerase
MSPSAPSPISAGSPFGLFGRDFITADGVRTMIVVVTPRQWANLVGALGLESAIAALETARRVSFATDDGLRFTHRNALFPLFEAAIAALDHSSLAARLDAGGIVHSAYRTMLDAANDPRLVRDNPIFGAAANPSRADYPAAGSFATIAGQQRGAPQSAPILGADTDEVLEIMLGLSPGQIAALHDRHVVTGA